MTTNAKIGIAVGVLVPVVFVVTLISQLPKTADTDTKLDDGGVGEVPAEGLRAAINELHYDPNNERAARRHHQQYYETGEHPVSFWLSNPNPVPVKVTFANTSCGACSFADLAVVPAPPVNADRLADPLAAAVGGIGPWAADEDEYRARRQAEGRLPPTAWKRLKAANSTRPGVVGEPFVEVPAAAGGSPTWVVVRLNVNVTERKILEATFACQPEGAVVPVPMVLKAAVVPVEPCEVFPAAIDFQSVGEEVGVLERTVFFFSATRPVGPAGSDGVLPPPDVAKFTGHLSFTPPEPATPDELAALARLVSAAPDVKVPKRVAGAYKTTLRFARTVRAGEKTTEADLGPFERTLSLVPQTGRDDQGNVRKTPMTLGTTPAVTVKATLLGAVALEPGRNVKDNKIDLGSFRTADGLDREVVVVSERPGLELEGVPAETTPNYLKVEADLPVERKGDRSRWTVRLKIDPGVGGGAMPTGSVLVLRIKGTGQLVRIPVSGTGGG